jgi:branched-chain amino acid aminotransferase
MLNKNTRVWNFLPEKTTFHLDRMEDKSSLDQASQSLADGVYTTFRTYDHNKVLRLEDHFDRLEFSAKLQNRILVLPRYVLRSGLREIIELYPKSDLRLRIHCAFMTEDIQIYLMAEQFSPYADNLYKNGASVLTLAIHRENPGSKATSFIEQTKEIRNSKPAGINEYFLLDKDGNLLEGMTSNIFVIKDNIIWTAEQGVLPGITRQVVLEVIASTGIEINYTGYPIEDIYQADEVFITSASRGIMPVTQINSRPIGSRKPGDITLKLKTTFEKRLQSELRSV